MNKSKKRQSSEKNIALKESSWFTKFAKWTSHASGLPATFFLALTTIAVWAITGPLFHFSDTWQLVINTGTTIVTFLMVFLIQNTQNRDSAAIHLKLDELIRATEKAHNSFLDIEELEELQLAQIRDSYRDLACRAREGLKGQEYAFDDFVPLVKDPPEDAPT